MQWTFEKPNVPGFYVVDIYSGEEWECREAIDDDGSGGFGITDVRADAKGLVEGLERSPVGTVYKGPWLGPIPPAPVRANDAIV